MRLDRIESASNWFAKEVLAHLEESHSLMPLELAPILDQLDRMLNSGARLSALGLPEMLTIFENMDRALDAVARTAQEREISINAHCRILAHILRADRIETMIWVGAWGESIRGVRIRRAAMFRNSVERLRTTCVLRCRISIQSSADSGEWVACLRESVRLARATYCLRRLLIFGAAYRMGFRVNIQPALEKLQLLFQGPH